MNADTNCCDAASVSEQHHWSAGGVGGALRLHRRTAQCTTQRTRGGWGRSEMMLGMEDKKDKCAPAAAAAAASSNPELRPPLFRRGLNNT